PLLRAGSARLHGGLRRLVDARNHVRSRSPNRKPVLAPGTYAVRGGTSMPLASTGRRAPAAVLRSDDGRSTLADASHAQGRLAGGAPLPNTEAEVVLATKVAQPRKPIA